MGFLDNFFNKPQKLQKTLTLNSVNYYSAFKTLSFCGFSTFFLPKFYKYMDKTRLVFNYVNHSFVLKVGKNIKEIKRQFFKLPVTL